MADQRRWEIMAVALNAVDEQLVIDLRSACEQPGEEVLMTLKLMMRNRAEQDHLTATAKRWLEVGELVSVRHCRLVTVDVLVVQASSEVFVVTIDADREPRRG